MPQILRFIIKIAEFSPLFTSVCIQFASFPFFKCSNKNYNNGYWATINNNYDNYMIYLFVCFLFLGRNILYIRDKILRRN